MGVSTFSFSPMQNFSQEQYTYSYLKYVTASLISRYFTSVINTESSSFVRIRNSGECQRRAESNLRDHNESIMKKMMRIQMCKADRVTRSIVAIIAYTDCTTYVCVCANIWPTNVFFCSINFCVTIKMIPLNYNLNTMKCEGVYTFARHWSNKT